LAIFGVYSEELFGNKVWVLKKRDEQRLEAAQMKFSGHLRVIPCQVNE
jgi:hypothetical protein